MENSLLIPGKYKVIGWIIFILSASLGIATLYWDYRILGLVLPLKESVFFDANLTNELALAGVIIGLMIIVFAREKI